MRDLSDDLHDLRESSEEYAEEVQNTQYHMAARIDAIKEVRIETARTKVVECDAGDQRCG